MKHPYRRRNPKVIALIIEIVLSTIGGIILLVLYENKTPLNVPVTLISTGVLLFSIILTLSLIRYDALRDIRADGTFKGSNLPLYTDQTTLQGHDIIEEREKDDK